jgi:hypothetical protein
MDDPAARQIIQACAEAGEQARLLPSVPMKMKLADTSTAMLPLTPNGTAGALIIRAPVILAALREYFERHCCIKRSHDHPAGRFIVCRAPMTARQAVRPLLRLCADCSVDADRKIYGLMIT